MKSAGLAIAAVAGGVILALPPPDGLGIDGWRVAAVTLFVAILWFTEAVPTPVAALVPFVALPLLGVGHTDAVAAAYMSPVVLLVLGGSFMAVAVEKWGLHRRLASRIMRISGTAPDRIVLALMVVTAAVAMLASGTTTMLFMLPIAGSLITGIAGDGPPETFTEDHRRFAKGLVVGIAYAATLGGFGLLISNPSNAIAAAMIGEAIQAEVGFTLWLAFGAPAVLLGVPLAWLVVTRIVFRHGILRISAGALAAAVGTSTPLTRAERRLLPVLMAAIAAWLAMPLLRAVAPGLGDAAVAICAAIALFVVRSGRGDRETLLDWNDAGKIPWGVLLLIGGGLALASAMKTSGLSDWMATLLVALGGLPLPVLLLAAVFAVILITEFASNIATAALAVPAFIALSVATGSDPLALGMMAALACKWGFVVPAGAPWLALAASSGYAGTVDVMRAGLWMDLVGPAFLVALCLGVAALV